MFTLGLKRSGYALSSHGDYTALLRSRKFLILITRIYLMHSGDCPGSEFLSSN